ncbi:hypothetical protein H9L39_01432 [Fusarium oxysporum f. sp. albedinis]|nr:hypothetical protein H9L39_01432 [Fusarium oxysporum f. sp. albedinis]
MAPQVKGQQRLLEPKDAKFSNQAVAFRRHNCRRSLRSGENGSRAMYWFPDPHNCLLSILDFRVSDRT